MNIKHRLTPHSRPLPGSIRALPHIAVTKTGQDLRPWRANVVLVWTVEPSTQPNPIQACAQPCRRTTAISLQRPAGASVRDRPIQQLPGQSVYRDGAKRLLGFSNQEACGPRLFVSANTFLTRLEREASSAAPQTTPEYSTMQDSSPVHESQQSFVADQFEIEDIQDLDSTAAGISSSCSTCSFCSCSVSVAMP